MSITHLAYARSRVMIYVGTRWATLCHYVDCRTSHFLRTLSVFVAFFAVADDFRNIIWIGIGDGNYLLCIRRSWVSTFDRMDLCHYDDNDVCVEWKNRMEWHEKKQIIAFLSTEKWMSSLATNEIFASSRWTWIRSHGKKEPMSRWWRSLEKLAILASVREREKERVTMNNLYYILYVVLW